MEKPTFRNPLYRTSLADPSILKFNGLYYAYGTPASGGLPVLRSTDLVGWDHAGEVLGPPPAEHHRHWAPEVAYDNGTFFLYYSTGDVEGRGHQLRVATGPSPTGPFEERTILEPEEPFTIDAHPFRDDDGTWYLYYCRDFLDGEPVGTGIVVDRLADMCTLAGEPTTVMRPHSEWHIYERQRRWYDRVWDWYTVEGPFVRQHDGRYWCFYSGGAWKAENYGVSSASADHPLGPFRPVSAEHGADVLRTVPGRVIGPGHGAVALAPDNMTEYLLYHAWDPDQTGRYLCADPLGWEDRRPVSSGPSTAQQPYPPQPEFRDLFGEERQRGLDPTSWDADGHWSRQGGEAVQTDTSRSTTALLRRTPPSSWLLEVNIRRMDESPPGGAYGVSVGHRDANSHTSLVIEPESGVVSWRRASGGAATAAVVARLPENFVAGAYHQLLLRRRAGSVEVMLDGVRSGAFADLPPVSWAVGLCTDATAAAFAGVTLTDLDRLAVPLGGKDG